MKNFWNNIISISLAGIFALGCFGAFPQTSQALTAQEEAQVEAEVGANPLVIKLSGQLPPAQDNATQKDTAADRLEADALNYTNNVYNPAVTALDACLKTPFICPENSPQRADYQAKVNTAEATLTEKNRLATEARAVADAAQAEVDRITRELADAKTVARNASVKKLTGQAEQQQALEALQGSIEGANNGQNVIPPGGAQESTYNGSTQGQTTAKPLPTNQEQQLIDRLQGGCGNLITDFMGCISTIPYYILYVPSAWLLTISGMLFDTSIALSIDSNFVNQQFVNDLWKVVRDFSNMLFIFILLFTGIQTILGIGKNWQKTVLSVIGVALIINFSLFFTKVVIDTGNILAVGVYQAMGSVKNPGNGSMLQSFGGNPAPEERDLSAALVANFAPQKFLSKAGSVPNWNAVVIFIVAAAVNLFAAYVFLQVALIFIGRLLAFWLLMIASPLAFLTIAFPALGKKTLSFEKWLSLLVSQSFVAPVFLFLMYLLMKIISANGGIMNSFIH